MKKNEYGSKRVYFAVIVTMIVLVFATGGIFYVLIHYPPVSISGILRAPIEAVPIDSGWIGLALTLVNGFLLSYVLAGDGVDATERLLLSVGLGFGCTFVVMILLGVLWEYHLFACIPEPRPQPRGYLHGRQDNYNNLRPPHWTSLAS